MSISYPRKIREFDGDQLERAYRAMTLDASSKHRSMLNEHLLPLLLHLDFICAEDWLLLTRGGLDVEEQI